jgi:hypothetical protein
LDLFIMMREQFAMSVQVAIAKVVRIKDDSPDTPHIMGHDKRAQEVRFPEVFPTKPV